MLDLASFRWLELAKTSHDGLGGKFFRFDHSETALVAEAPETSDKRLT
jgi:hypothetical protein